MDLKILNIIYKNPGIKVSEIQKELFASGFDVSENKIRNSIKRKIHGYINIKGQRKQVVII